MACSGSNGPPYADVMESSTVIIVCKMTTTENEKRSRSTQSGPSTSAGSDVHKNLQVSGERDDYLHYKQLCMPTAEGTLTLELK